MVQVLCDESVVHELISIPMLQTLQVMPNENIQRSNVTSTSWNQEKKELLWHCCQLTFGQGIWQYRH